MTKSQDLNKKSVGDLLGEIEKVTTEEQAAAIVEREVRLMGIANGTEPAEAHNILLSNIGYLSGYCDHDTADRILKLFHTEHPYSGLTHPTAEEALAIGMRVAKEYEASKAVKEQHDPTNGTRDGRL